MIKVQVIENFSLARFKEIKNLVRANTTKNTEGYLYMNDIFECSKSLVEYLTKTNAKGKAFVKVIEIIPEKKDKEIKEKEPVTEKTKKEPAKRKTATKTTTKKTTKKSIAKN